MSGRAHLRVLAIATSVWAVFWVLGLPDYYLQYSRSTMVAVSLFLLPAIVAIAWVVLRRTVRERRVAVAAWLAFYFTVPLAFYDWLYCGVYLGYGLSFLRVFWYLTVFYVVPWLVLPPTAVLINRSSRSSAHRRPSAASRSSAIG